MKQEILNYIKTLSNNKQIQKLLIETIGTILLKQNNIDKIIKENENKIIHIRDWIASIIQNNEEWKTPRVLTIDALNNAANKYFEKQNNKLKTIELDDTHEKLIADLGDYYVVQMLTPEALDNESKIMQHCIGHGWYDQNLNEQNYSYLSLRDKFNKAHVTIETYKKEILQLQGKQNNIPEKKYLEIFIPWLIENKYNIILEKFDLVLNQIDNKIYSLINLPDNCQIGHNLTVNNLEIKNTINNLIINGNTHFNQCTINKISNNLNINGDLYLNELDTISEISDNLTVNGELNIYNCNDIKKLPDNLNVNGDIWMEVSKIEEIKLNHKFKDSLYASYSDLSHIDDNMIINGNLDLSHCKKLKKLPNGLEVKNHLFLNYSSIKTIPQDIKIGGILSLNYSEIEKLPNNLTINDNLVLDYCYNIKKLPENLTVLQSLSLYGSNIKILPQNIKIGKNLNLNASKIEKLPDNLVVNGDLSISCCENFKKLPKGLTINGDLNLIFSKITELPEDLKVTGTLKIKYSEIKMIPNNFKCNSIAIKENQISLIHNGIDFEYIEIDDEEYSKKLFLKNYSPYSPTIK